MRPRPGFCGKNNPVDAHDSPFMSDEGGGGGASAGEEMAERGSSSRKTGRGVKWRQVFHAKPYNPPPLPLLQFPPQTGPLRSQEQTLVPRFPIFSFLLLFPVIQPPYPSDLIYPTQIAAFSFNPSFLFTVSSVCCPNWTTWLCGLNSYKTPVGLSAPATVFPPLLPAPERMSNEFILD